MDQAVPKEVTTFERRVLRTNRKEYVEVDSRVNEEIVRRQTKGERLTNPWIREYAQHVASQLHPQMPDDEINKFFDANWLYRFKRRYSVELKPRSQEEIAQPPVTNESDESSSPLAEKIQTMCTTIKEEDEEEKVTSASDYYSQMLQIHHYWSLMSQGGGAPHGVPQTEQN
uniref:HTH CENPB-type domain-containing protein n=1 Tax=Caenorhabditis japonica TaxID=281687 RepID=A0A8R1IK19_CAEJA